MDRIAQLSATVYRAQLSLQYVRVRSSCDFLFDSSIGTSLAIVEWLRKRATSFRRVLSTRRHTIVFFLESVEFLSAR